MTSASRAHEQLRMTVDLVILTVREGVLQLLLIERGNEPYRGRLALPGGFLRVGEDVLAAAARELREETGLDAAGLHLRQLTVFGLPDRDPRGRVVTVPYLAIAPDLPMPVAGTDAWRAQWEPVEALTSAPDRLAFDHHEILEVALEQARRSLEYTTVATGFCAPAFTIGDLRRVYEAVWGSPLDPRNFSRKVKKTEGFVIPTGDKRAQETGRPALLYSAGPATQLYPPMLRSGDPDDQPG